MPLFDRATPHRYVRWAMRVLYVTTPMALLLLLAWGFRVPLAWARPQLLLMAYMLLLAVSMGAGIVAALGSCHLAISKAFSAGVHVGQQDRPAPPRTNLRSVE